MKIKFNSISKESEEIHHHVSKINERKKKSQILKIKILIYQREKGHLANVI